MLNIDSLHTMAMLVDLGERDQAKEVAEGILATAEKSELQIINQCADILDTHAPNVAKAKLDLFARELDDQHRTHSSAMVRFCTQQTGARVRRPADDEAPTSLSVFTDSRPGYAEEDDQPSGLENPTPWEIKRAQRLAQLTHQLRDYWKDLPPHVRTALRTVKARPMPDNSHPDDFQILDEYPQGRETYNALRRRRMSHTLAFAIATTPEAQWKAMEAAKQKADDYARTRLGVEDHTAPRGTVVTIFDIDDHRAEKARYRSIRCQLCQHLRDDDTATGPDDGLCRECRHVMATFRATPCVFCWVERTYDDHRGTAYTFGHATGHDDGLCGECREKNRPGLRPVQATPRRMRSVAYLHPEDRAATADHAAIAARCASVANHLPPGLALKWLRAYYCVASEAHRPAITRWVSQWRNSHQPQPPTPVTPAADPAAAPVRALAAA